MIKITRMAAIAALALSVSPAIASPTDGAVGAKAETTLEKSNSIGAESGIVNLLALTATAGAVVGLIALTGGEESDTPVSN